MTLKIIQFNTALISLILTTLSIIFHAISKYTPTVSNIYNTKTAYWILLFALLSLAISYLAQLRKVKQK